VHAPESADPIDELLAECLRAADPFVAIELTAAAHPSHAAELRRRWEFLVAAGAAGAATQAPPLRQLGRFRLLDRIGGGGMGVVYLAIEEPPGREVALKLVRPEQVWFEGSQRRFEREVALIAGMQHPGIVPVYSCGEQDGVPFCAMEYVRGQSLAELLATLRRSATAPAPAALRQPDARNWVDACFTVALQVADALVHVHERGVVHRDVKPSNVLLDEAGRARLIDFGLARGGGSESLTRSGVQPGSLAYMSPEQVRGDAVDARTDVWSLGVTLLELITLEHPFAAATEERTRRAILAGVPSDPRGTSRVPWDAATVIGTAMAPERERRYPTMAAFAADLRACLERRPIAARRPGPWLRLRRWVQRHPARTATIALLVALFGLLPSALLLHERAARQDIAREATTARRVLQFLEELFYEVDPSRARGETVPARVVLDRGVQRIRTELADEPAIRVALLQAMGTVYLNLGLVERSEELLGEAQMIRERSFAGDTAGLHEVRRRLARCWLHMSRNADAERMLRDSLASMRPDDPMRADTLLLLADAVWHQDRALEALQIYDDALAAIPPDADERRRLDARRNRAELLLARIDPARARAEFRAVHDGLLASEVELDPIRLWAMHGLADAELECGDPRRAEALLRDATDSAARLLDADHPLVAALRERLAEALMHLGRPDEGLQFLDRARDAHLKTYRRPHWVVARAMNLESSLAYEAGDFARAEDAARAALREFEALEHRSTHDYAVTLGNLARVLLMLGHWGEARDLAQKSVELHQRLDQRRPDLIAFSEAYLAYAGALLGDADAGRHAAAACARIADRADARARATVRCYAAEVALLGNRVDEASELARAAERDWQQLGSPLGQDWARFVQGWAQNARGDAAAAEQVLQSVLERQRETCPPGHPYIVRTLIELGVALCRQQRLDDGIARLQEAVAALRGSLGADSRMLALPTLNLGMAQFRRKQPQAAALAGLEVLRILRAHRANGDRLVEPGIRLVLAALPGIDDPAERAQRQAALREAAGALLPEGHALRGQIDGGR
jgi:tetratricopeptide (TPR) repeat protein/tRNA A-37 threonylcarbamoyl transferase component Bud32